MTEAHLQPRSRHWFIPLFGLLVLVAAAVGSPAAFASDPANGPTGESVIVRFRAFDQAPGTLAARVEATAADAEAEPLSDSLADDGYRRVAVPQGIDREAFLAELNARPDVLSAEPDATVLAAAAPNDPHYAASQAAYLEKIGVPEAWDLATGQEEVVIAVLDSGLDTGHPDFEGRLWLNPLDADDDGVDDDGNGCIDDRYGCRFIDATPARQAQCGYPSSTPVGNVTDDDGSPGSSDHSHGTIVSGIIGAGGNNGKGIAGVGWNIKIMPVKVLDCGIIQNGQVPGGDMGNVAQGIDYARRMGANIINLSLASAPNSPDADLEVLRTAIAAAESAGIPVVAAAGNHAGLGLGYPAAYTQFSNVLGIGASQPSTGTTWESFSSYGDGVDFAAPGRGIAGTTRTDLGLATPYGASPAGTSYSAPLVSGVFALMISRNSRLALDEYIAIARDTATTAQPAPHGGNWAGDGIINAEAAVARVPMTVTGTPLHNWIDVPAGTAVTASVGEASCGSSTVAAFGPVSRFSVRVLADNERPGCGAPGREVRISFGGKPATQMLPWGDQDDDLALVNLQLSSVDPAPGPVVVQSLQSGWSILAQLGNSGNVPGSVSHLPSGWSRVSRYDALAEGYDSYAPGIPAYAATLGVVQQFDVLWVNGPAANIAVPNPDAPPRAVELYGGWNPILYTGGSAPVADALANVDGLYTHVLHFNNDAAAWETFIPGRERYSNDFAAMLELEIYWVYMTGPGIISMV